MEELFKDSLRKMMDFGKPELSPKEKAHDLIGQFIKCGATPTLAEKLSIITVKEIIKHRPHSPGGWHGINGHVDDYLSEAKEYWETVLSELNSNISYVVVLEGNEIKILNNGVLEDKFTIQELLAAVPIGDKTQLHFIKDGIQDSKIYNSKDIFDQLINLDVAPTQ